MLYNPDGKALSGKCPEGYIKLPALTVKASAGPGAEAFIIDTESYYVISRRLLWPYDTELERARILSVQGDSMNGNPAYLRDGDFIICIEGLNNGTDGVYVLNVGGHIRVKRLQFRLDGMIDVISDNPAYKPEVLDPSESNVLIVGRVVKFIH